MRTDCIVKLSKLQISELNTLVQKETSGDVEGNLLLRTTLTLSTNASAAVLTRLILLASYSFRARKQRLTTMTTRYLISQRRRCL
jgi:hypothetical protein